MARASAVTISLSDDERAELEALSRRRKTGRRGLRGGLGSSWRRRKGWRTKEIAVRLEASADTVGKWRRRYAAEGLDGLYDEPRPGAPRQIGDDAIAEAVRLTLEETPPDAMHWSLRSMARASGHARSRFIASGGAFGAAASLRDLQAVERSLLRGEAPRIVGLYLAPPDRALVLCSTKRARSRPWTVPSPSCRCAPGRRSGAPITSAARASRGSSALDIATGEIIGKCFPRHRAREFDLVEANVPADLDGRHGNSGLETNGDPPCSPNGRAGRPFQTDPSAAWLNQVERWFGLATDKQIRRGVHRSTKELERTARLHRDNQNPRSNGHPPMTSSPSSASASEKQIEA